MQYIGSLFNMLFGFLQREFVLYGYTFSYWGVIIFVAVASIIGAFLWNFIFD